MKKIIAISGFLGIFAFQAVNVSAAHFNRAPIVRCDTQITQTLKLGSENNDVFTLQAMLVSTGYLKTAPNGYYGYQTQSAVRAFQAYNGIATTGTVGQVTRDAINERLCGGDYFETSFSSYDDGYYTTTGVTYVSDNDPYIENVRVIVPPSSTPVVYKTPQDASQLGRSYVASSPLTTIVSPSNNTFSSSQIIGSGIVYNPASGYSYGITPAPSSLSVSSPVANSVYQEGDTVFVQWATNNIVRAPYSVLLESNISGQSKVVGVTDGNSFSFVLTRDLLEAVCAGSCNNGQLGSFKIVVTTPTTDIAGITSTLRAVIAPITIKRPLSNARVSITTSKTPVNSGEVFKLYINVPTNTYGYNTSSVSDSYSVRLRAVCPSSVSVSIAGVLCGQEFVVPQRVINAQQEIPAMISNATWYKQEVTFQVTVINLANQVIGTSETKVTVNAAPFNW